MVGKDIIEMRIKELKRLKIIHEAIEKHITQKTAASIIGVTERHVRRIIKAVREEGDKGIIHKSRGKASNRRISEKIKDKVLKLYKKNYYDFGPTLASEKLLGVDNIKISAESLRKWLIEDGVWKRRRKRSGHKQWRQRKACFGEMVQIDGSHHDWLEGRGPELVLMGYIDDATNTTFGRFYDYEGTIPAMDSFHRYIRRYGIPQSVYLDRHTTYKSPRRLTPEEELEGIPRVLSQFERALSELGVKVIHAYSPQAKGRVERIFGVLQDRLVKEMRLKGIKTKQEANDFLEEYLPVYNRQFSIPAANDTDIHMELPKYFNAHKALCIKTQRTVKNDHTIVVDSKLYQIEDKITSRKVIVEEKVDGSLHIMNNGASLKYREITERPRKIQNTYDRRVYNQPPIPSKDHPWRRWDNCNSKPKRRIYPY
jgi:transposase